MGLDMYLKKGKRIPKIPFTKYMEINNKISDNKLLQIKYRKYIQTCGDKEIYTWKALTKEVGYWRKANHIHNFFVEVVQKGYDDCGEYRVTKAALKGLLSRCNKVLAASKLVPGRIIDYYTFDNLGDKVPHYTDGLVIEDSTVAEKLLPVKDGFFFGSTSYDKFYIDSIKYTIELINNILETTDFSKYYITYTSSW